MCADEVRPLEHSEFERWEELVRCSPQGTLFHTQLWLKASGLPFQLLGCFSGRDMHGGFCVSLVGKRTAGPPHSALTPYFGILFPPPYAKYVSTLSSNKRIASAFAVFLKHEFDAVQFRFPPEVTDLQPFIWQNFDVGIRYTYRLTLGNLNAVLKEMDGSRRNDLRSAERNGIIVNPDAPFEVVMALSEKSFARQGLKADVTGAAVNFNRALERVDRCRAFLALSRDGGALGGVWIVWDDRRAYYLIGGYDELLRSNNAVALALWRAIEFTARELKLQEFDFEGSMVPAVERFFRKFGGRLMPTYSVSYAKPVSLLRRVARRARRLLDLPRP